MRSGCVLVILSALVLAASGASDVGDGVRPFAAEGPPVGWTVRNWVDVAQEPPPGARWTVQDGILRGSEPRGTWLASDRDYSDFVLDFEFRLAERGQSGVALRIPPVGDPAVEGLVVQLVDPRFFGAAYPAKPTELTGALSKLVPPLEQVFVPLEWNRCSITCAGPAVTVVLNGKRILEVNLDRETQRPPRGRSLADRPRRGRIGFLELTRGTGHVEFREVRLRARD